MSTSFPAHIRILPTCAVQSVQTHCINTAKYASETLESVNLSQTAYLSGLLHDMGKMTEEFRSYLESSVYGCKDVRRGSVIHSFTGTRYVLEKFHSSVSEDEVFCSELVALAIASHHGQIDCVDEKHYSGFDHRLTKDGICYEEAVKNYTEQCANEADIKQLFMKAVPEIIEKLNKIEAISARDKSGEEAGFYLGLLTRLILSAIIEGDRRDTADFMNSSDLPEKIINYNKPLWKDLGQKIELKFNEFQNNSEIALARRLISEECRDFSVNEPGIYQLNVPTGAGKTLSSLRYAVNHAAKWNKSRIIFTSPLLSILEQNAAVIKSFINDDSLVLEHHSNIVKSEDCEALDYSELLAENWNSPIIITTLVQLLNTLFSGKTSCIRRFQALCNSVIIIDEVQTVPGNMLSLFNLGITFLSEICGSTVVLCSATQPCWDKADHSLLQIPQDIIPYRSELWKIFKRTELIPTNPMLLKEVPAFVQNLLVQRDSVLVVCNKKDEAEYILQSVEYDCDRFHLSSSMCPYHRLYTIRDIRNNLETNKISRRKTLCVSTQVIEAGVDISFSCVVRLSAGMDNVVQSAGRCNRNHESDIFAPVYILTVADENLSRLPEIQRSKSATEALIADYNHSPELFDGDLFSEKAIHSFYSNLYKSMPFGFQDFTTDIHGKRLTLFDLLSLNSSYVDLDMNPKCGNYLMAQAFKTAGNAFCVFDDSTQGIIVPYGEGKRIISELASADCLNDLSRAHKLLSLAKPYTISLYGWQLISLEKMGAVYHLCDNRITVLREEFYDSLYGVQTKSKKSVFMEV